MVRRRLPWPTRSVHRSPQRADPHARAGQPLPAPPPLPVDSCAGHPPARVPARRRRRLVRCAQRILTTTAPHLAASQAVRPPPNRHADLPIDGLDLPPGPAARVATWRLVPTGRSGHAGSTAVDVGLRPAAWHESVPSAARRSLGRRLPVGRPVGASWRPPGLLGTPTGGPAPPMATAPVLSARGRTSRHWLRLTVPRRSHRAQGPSSTYRSTL